MKAILSKLDAIETSLFDIKSDVQQLKGDVQELKGDVQQLQGGMCALNKEMALVARIAYTMCVTASNIYHDPHALGAAVNHLNDQKSS